MSSGPTEGIPEWRRLSVIRAETLLCVCNSIYKVLYSLKLETKQKKSHFEV